jgi:Tol biopolymer transport system component
VFTPNNSGPLFRVSAAGGKAEPVTKIEGPGGNHRLPHFLPDGRHFTYSGADNKAYVGVLGASETHKIVDGVEGAAQYVKAGYLVFQRSEALLAQRFDPVRLTVTGNAVPVADHVSPGAWSVSDDGVITYRKSVAIAETAQQLVWFDRGGKELERTGIPSAYAGLGFSLSPDAQQLAIVTRAAKADRPYLFLLELKRRALSRFTDLFPATYPLWAPTGGGIVFGHFEPNNNMDLYRKSTHGGAEAMLLHSDANKAATDWSADGKFILYRTPEPKTSFDVWAMSSDGTQPFPIAETEADERDAQFSTDGKWVAYQSNESGRFEIYVQPFRGAGAKQNISINGGAQVRWGRDGRELFYIALNGKLMSVPIRYSRDAKSIAAGEATPLFPAHVVVVQFDRQQYFVSPDGQQFLIKALNEEGAPAPISVILNYKPKW